jgi:asparagine synthase (glutamine-hydrolysing)
VAGALAVLDSDSPERDAMCGIAGVLNFDGRPVGQVEIEALTNALAHRGRDSAAFALGAPLGTMSAYAGVALGHRRLSIIDLSCQANQPMATLDGRLWLVYNGELYNYRELRQELLGAGYQFRTDSDSEVVLLAFQAWGEACLARFNGMFAFAIWSESTQSLFCARDPIGIKPFYYSHDQHGFRFASESQALARSRDAALDPKAVASYFLCMYVPRHLSMVAGVHKLLPGHCMSVTREGAVRTTAYWRLPAVGSRPATAADPGIELQRLLDQAVRLQLRSDVPVGAFLSGGFDSGMIVAAASRASTALHTYSVGFDDGVQLDELPIARSLANRYGTSHHERVIQGDEVMGWLDRAVASMSEPVADSAIVPTHCLSQMAADDGVKVLLSGTGGDEVFAGYSRYVGSSPRRRLLYHLPRALRQGLGRTVWAHTPFGARLRHPSLDMVMYTGGSAQLAQRLFPGLRSFDLFLEELATDIFPATIPGSGGLYESMQFDLQVYLPDLLLMLFDQLTMTHTIEGRVPLLDVDLISASYRLPPEWHATPARAETRKLMRKMAAGQLDSRTLTGRKQGFSGPVRLWIERNRSQFRERIMDSRDIPFLRDLDLDGLWRSDAASQNDFWATEVFSIYCFSSWYRAHASRA